MSDTTIPTLPEGLWSQPQPRVPELGAVEPVQRIRVPASIVYDYTPGTAPSAFLRALADKRILGGRCAQDPEVYVPPRGVSPVVGRRFDELVEVGPNATITSFCVVHIGFGENAPPTPFVSALILPDGAAVSLYGTVLGIALEDIRIGMRVQPVWAPDGELTTSFENITHWEPIDEPDVDAELLKGHM
jgi:uncharacterized OB-fold protein